MSSVKLVSIHTSEKAEIKAWTVKDSTEFGAPGEHPAGICVLVRAKDHTYEAVIPMTEIGRVYLEYVEEIELAQLADAEAGIDEAGIACLYCEPCGLDCPYCTFDGECACRLGC
jgi:hypothetical protein